jgi:hypothetical protein
MRKRFLVALFVSLFLFVLSRFAYSQEPTPTPSAEIVSLDLEARQYLADIRYLLGAQLGAFVILAILRLLERRVLGR